MRRVRQDQDEQSLHSEVLADLALNSFGLIMVVLLVYMLVCRQPAKATTPREATAATSASAAAVRAENLMLRQELEKLQRQAEAFADGAQVSGLWRFKIHVTQLVDHLQRAEPADFEIDYFVWLQIDGDRVTGSLFGVKDYQARVESSSHAELTGSRAGSQYEIVLAFTGAAAGGTEILQVRKEGDRFVGRLISGSTKIGYSNYVGDAVGTRLEDSVFAS